METTHRKDPETGNMVQIVSAEELRRVLDESGDDYSRPKDFTEYDEWDVGPLQCDECGGTLTAAEMTRNERENSSARYDANAYVCDQCVYETEI